MCVLAVCCLFTHRRVIRALIKHEPMHKASKLQIPAKRREHSEMSGAAIPEQRRGHSDTNGVTSL